MKNFVILKPFSDIRIGRVPDSFMVYVSKFGKEKPFCLLKQDFLSKILEKYSIVSLPFRLQLYFLQFPKRKAFLNYLFFPLSILFKNHFNFNRFSNNKNKPYRTEKSIKKLFEKVIYLNKSNISVINPLHGQSPLPYLSIPNIQQPESDTRTIISHYNKLFFNSLLTSINSIFFSDKKTDIEKTAGLNSKDSSRELSKKISEGIKDHNMEENRDKIQPTNISSDLKEKVIDFINVKNSYFSNLTVSNYITSNMISKKQNLSSLSDINQPGLQKDFSSKTNAITSGNMSYFYFPRFIFNKFSSIDLFSQKTNEENVGSMKTPKSTKDFLSITNKNDFSFKDIDYFHLPKFIFNSSPTIGIISNKIRQENIQNTRELFPSERERKKTTESKLLTEQSKQYPRNYLQKNNFRNSSRDVIKNNYFHKESNYLSDFPSIKYFYPNLKEYPEILDKKNIKKTNFKSPSLNNSYFPTDKTPSPVYPTGDNLFHLADKVYKIIVERVRREKEMGGY